MDGGIVAVLVIAGLVYGYTSTIIISECYSNKTKNKYINIDDKIEKKSSIHFK